MKVWLLLPLVLSACTGMSGVPSQSESSGNSAAISPAHTLPRYQWQLSDAVDGDNNRLDALFGEPGKPLELNFTQDRISVSNACNTISGQYHIVDGHLESHLLLSTMMACMDHTLQQRETIIKLTLHDKPSLILSNQQKAPQLSLVSASGQTLTFTGKPTPETRYNGPAETVFLEVAAPSAACVTSAGTAASCLRVRERHYDANGLSSGTPGPWHALQQSIEEFTPQAGVRYVLRLKRYAHSSSSNHAPPAYVLDTIVESGPPQPSN